MRLVDMQKNTGGIANVFTSLAAIFKAAPEGALADLRDSLDHAGAASISDMWNEKGGEHRAPSRAEVVTGPAEPMSGRGAEKMIREYSDLAPQGGMTALYQRFEGILNDFGKSLTADFDRKFGALADVVSEHAKAFTALKGVADAAVADTTAKAGEPDGDTFFGKAQIKFVKAQKAFRKAEMEEDEDSREERKSRLTEIADVLKSALKLISKADEEEKHEDEEVEKAVATVKALQQKVSVALGAIHKAEEDEKKAEEEKAEKARQAEATAKAEAEAAAAGGATAKAETEEEEEKKDDTAKSQALAQQVAETVAKALEGKTVIPGTMDEVFRLLTGMSKSLAPAPDMAPVAKAAQDVAARLEAANDAGQLTGPEAIRGRELLARQAAVAAGKYDAGKFANDVAASPTAVRDIFQLRA